MSEFKFPTEEIELPSKGLIYPKDNPLSSGKVEVKYMTAKEEDILSNQSFIQKGVVLDKLLKSVIIDKDINIDDLIVGDKNALLIATRVLGYGKDYHISVNGADYTIDMTTLEHKDIDDSTFVRGENEFPFTTPSTGTVLTYKLATGKIEKQIDREIAGLKKINKENSSELTTRLKYLISSVDGDSETKTIREFVDYRFLARDSRAFREHINATQPDVNLNYVLDNGEEALIPIGINFFGLTTNNAPQVRINLFNIIHQIIFHGKGGYDFYTVYNMPIWLRKYTYSEIKNFYEEEKKQLDNASSGGKGSKNLVNTDGKVNVPAFAEASKTYKGQTSYK